MPFYGGVGIHDADSWRGSSYGGTIYQTSGSHGCINTPTANAAVIYENIEIGTPIVCYKATVYQGSSSGYESGGADVTIQGGDDLSGDGASSSENTGNMEDTGSGDVWSTESAADAEGGDTAIQILGEEDWADESTYWQ